MPSVKLDNCFGKQTQGLDRVVRLRRTLEQTLVGFDLLLACFAVGLGLLQLAGCDLVKTHTDQVVWVNLGDHIGIFDKLEALLAVELSFLDVGFIVSQVQLVPSEDIHGSNSDFLIVK